MAREFDKDFWERHWREGPAGGAASMAGHPPNPYLARETGGLTPGTALDAGCGGGAEAVWLAARGWQVTGVDISAEALALAAGRAGATPAANPRWVEADLGVWTPAAPFDLVMTHYAHPAMPQLAFYDRIAEWVAPGGTLLIVGHLATSEAGGPGRSHDHAHGHGHAHGRTEGPDHGPGHHPSAEASVTAATIAERLDTTRWELATAEEHVRTLGGRQRRTARLHDVVVRATRRR